MSANSVSRPLCVVLDTNQWDAHTMLRSHLAASLIFLIERHGGKLAIPEVVAREVENHLVEAYKKEVRDISSRLGRVRMILGHSPDPDFLPEEAVRDSLRERLAELGGLVVTVAALDQHFIAAGRMVLAGVAPNAKGSQQFKDCLMWRAVLDLASGHDVLLVTGDSGFYADARSNALHADLVSSTGRAIRLARSMEHAVSLLQENAPSLDLGPVFDAIDAALRPRVDETASQRGFHVEAVNNADGEPFVTGRPGETLIVFELTHDLLALDGRLARVVTAGEAIVKSGTVSSLAVDSMELEVYGDAGFQRAARFLTLGTAAETLGGRQRNHEVRVPAPGAHLPL